MRIPAASACRKISTKVPNGLMRARFRRRGPSKRWVVAALERKRPASGNDYAGTARREARAWVRTLCRRIRSTAWCTRRRLAANARRKPMTEDPSRRDVLMTATALTAAASVGVAASARAQSAKAQGTPNLARVDAVLRAAVDAKEVPGVVAMATTDKGLLYQGSSEERRG